MGQSVEQWAKVDDFLVEHLVPGDACLSAALAANLAAGLPAHDVAPNQGKLLHIFARMVNAKRILEIGTLGGYSTIWLARALPAGGQVITLEADPKHAEIARANIARAGLVASVDLRTGPALETLPTLEGGEPFDLIFIDADKPNNPSYLAWALRLARPGTIIVGDNIVRDGAIVDPHSSDPRVRGVQEFIGMLGTDARLTSTAIQTVGNKGWDGFTISIVS